MLHLHLSNRTEALLEALLGRLSGSGRDPFAEEQLLVPSAGLRRWLTLSIAARHGICAQVRFDFLAPWLWRLTAAVRPDVPAESPLATSALVWRVLAAFEDAPWRAAHPVIDRWLGNAEPVMRWELARRSAALFEQYQTYRPDWLEAWAAGEAAAALTPDADGHVAWQTALWRRLAGELGALPHPTRDLGPALAAGHVPLPASVHVFALPSMPPSQLSLLRAAAMATEVHLYLLNPCQEYWFDLVSPRTHARLAARGRLAHHETGHRLLASWGQSTREHLSAMLEAADDETVDDERWQAPTGTTLLQRLQHSLLTLESPAPGSWPLDAADRSLELHLAHSRVREIEVLHDRLLSLFAADSTLEPSQVLVVTPDLEATAPLVDAVFGTIPETRRIPYAISGLARSRRNQSAVVLLELLDLPSSRYPASRVLALLQRPAVARRFGLDDEALEQIGDWLLEAGLHWSLDDSQREQRGLAGLPPWGWAEAVERLFLGHATPPGPSAPFAGVVPVGDPAGLRGLDAQALGGLWSFVEALKSLHADWSRPRPATSWPASLAAGLAAFQAPTTDSVDERLELQAALDRLQAQLDGAGTLPVLPAAVVRRGLEQLLDDPPHGGVAGGSVTFTSMSSLRAVPFRVVCAIGLDDGSIPSPQQATEFDLMALAPRRGDRQRRLDERALWLDLLLAARDTLHLSCRGRDAHDDSPLPPSVLVAELLDFLIDATTAHSGATDFAAARQAAWARRVVQHPLQPFGEGAFDRQADPRLRSHDLELADACRARAAAAAGPTQGVDDARVDPTVDEPGLPVPSATDDDGQGGEEGEEGDGDIDTVEAREARSPVPGVPPFMPAALSPPTGNDEALTLADIASFLRHPARHLLRTRLRLELPAVDEALQDDEAFSVDLPRRRALARRLLPLLRQREDEDSVRAAAWASGLLPAGPLGQVWLDREMPTLRAHAAALDEWATEPLLPPRSATLELEVEGRIRRLHAHWSGMRPSGLQVSDYDELRIGALLQAWVSHLAWCTTPPDEAAPAAAVTHGLARSERWRFEPSEAAAEQLAELAALALHGRTHLLPWLPKTAWAWQQGHRRSKAARDKWRGARAGADSTQASPFSESLDRWMALAWRGRPDPLEHEMAAFEALTAQVLDPLVAHLHREPLIGGSSAA